MADGEDDGVALKQLQQACKALRDEMTSMYDQRGGRHNDEARLKQRRWRILLLLSAMKSGLRDTFLEADTRRNRVQEQKDVAEAHQLQLQNLLYEKDHLLREIRRCRGFSTKEMDQIEFTSGDLPIKVDQSVHRQHLDQLTEELHARKSLQAELKEIKLKIAKVEDATETKQAFLSTLPDHLAGIEAATTGLQKYMGEPVTAQRSRQHAAGVELPTPLYALYCELEAYQTASGEAGNQLAIEIVDSVGVKSASSYRKRGFPAALDRHEQPPTAVKKLKAPSRSPSAGVNGGTPSQSRAPSRSPSAKRGLENAAQEPENGEIVVATHTAEKLLELRPHASSAGDDAKEENSESKQNEDADASVAASEQNLWKPHPRALQLTVSVEAPLDASKNVSGSFAVMFQYFPVAKVVTAEVVKTVPAAYSHVSHQKNNILMNLFPGDDGLTVPHLAVNYAFQENGEAQSEMEFPANAACRPYYWAQWICGLDPMKRPDAFEVSEEKPRRRPEPSIRNVMSQLVKRFVATAVLKKHLDQLTKSSSSHRPVDDSSHFVHPLARHLFPHEVKTNLEEWKEIPMPAQDVFQLFKERAAPTTAPRAQFHLATTGCHYYRAVFKNGRAKVSAIVEIAPEYPVRAPRFLFQPRSAMSSKALDKDQLPVYENQLKEVEVEVNAYYDELIPKGSEHFLLLHQLRKIELCFDVLCNGASDGEADVTLCFGRERRGKDRRQAMVMDTSAKELRHR
ncbi:THO complex subunit 5 [Phytophthora boehmeriae]|uniref:THO complex subunit 5 n=1 Tax=Phytophthora boehmeriae TaxID=109152 RepID=A0A8T1WT42_9STRA|nr:THO complex subunit 5 [Phytophthora boehmeriae]